MSSFDPEYLNSPFPEYRPDDHFAPAEGFDGDTEMGSDEPSGFNPDEFDASGLESMFAEDRAKAEAAASQVDTSNLFTAPTQPITAVPAPAPAPAGNPPAVVGVRPVTAGSPHTRTYTPKTGNKRSDPRRAIAVVAAVGLVAVIGGGYALTRPHSTSKAVVGTPTLNISHSAAPKVIDRAVPAGWKRQYVWKVSGSPASNVSVGLDNVGFISAAGNMVVLNDNGAMTLSSTPVGFASPVAAITTAGGTPVAVALDPSSAQALLWTLPPKNPDAGATKVALPSGASLSWSGGALLATKGQQAWRVGADGKASKVTLPSGYSALAVAPDGTVTAAKPSTGWQLLPKSGKPKTVNPQNPKGLSGKMSPAWQSKSVVVGWGSTTDPNKRVVAFYNAQTGKLLAQGMLSTSAVNQGIPLSVNAAGTMAAAGPLVANLTTGATKQLPGWKTVSTDSNDLYGTVSGDSSAITMVTSLLSPVSIDPKTTAIPWGADGAGRAIVVDTDSDGTQSVAALPRG